MAEIVQIIVTLTYDGDEQAVDTTEFANEWRKKFGDQAMSVGGKNLKSITVVQEFD